MSSLGQLGSLVVSIEANMASFQSDLGRVSQMAEEATHKIEAGAEMAKKALETLGVATTLVEFGESLNKTIDFMDGLDKLSKKTGVTVESLSSMATAAKFSDVSMSEAGGALEKLSRNMVAAADGTGKAAPAFDALGLSVRDANGNMKTADAMILEAAKSLEQYRDGTTKTAIEMQLFGRSGAELGAFLKELSERGLDNARVTTEQAKAAAEYNDNLKAMSIASEDFKIALVSNMLHPLTDITAAMVEAQKESGILEAALVGIGGAFTGIFTDDLLSRQQQITKELKHWQSEMSNALYWGSMLDKVGLWKNKEAELASYTNRMIGLEKELAALQNIPGVGGKAKPDAPTIKAVGEQFKVDSAYAAYVKAQQDALYKSQHEAFASAQIELDMSLKNNLVSIADYYGTRQSLEIADSAMHIEAVKKSLVAEQIKVDNPKSEEAKYLALAKIATLQGELNKLEADGGRIGSQNAQAYLDAWIKYANSRSAIEQQLYKLDDNSTASYLEELGQKWGDTLNKMLANGDTAGVEMVNKLIRVDLVTAQLDDVSKAFSKSQTDLSNVEKSIQIDQQKGLVSQFDASQKILDVRKSFIPVMKDELAALQAIDQTAMTPDQIQRAAALRLALDGIAASASNVNRTFQYGAMNAIGAYRDAITNAAAQTQNLYTNAFKGMEDALVNFVRHSKLDFSSLADSIVNDLIRIQVQQSIMQPLTGMVSGPGMGGIFGDIGNMLLGGGSGAGAATLISQQDLAASLGIPFAATGTDYVPNDMLIFAHQGEKIIPASQNNGGSNSVVVNVIESSSNAGQVQQRNNGGVSVIDVFVEKVKNSIASDITRGTGTVPAAMSRTFGVNRVAGSY